MMVIFAAICSAASAYFWATSFAGGGLLFGLLGVVCIIVDSIENSIDQA